MFHLENAARPRGSPESRGQTKSAYQIVIAQVGERGAQDSVGTSDKPRGRLPELLQTAPSKASRSRLSLWTSRTLHKVGIFDFVKLLRIGLELLLYVVA